MLVWKHYPLVLATLELKLDVWINLQRNGPEKQLQMNSMQTRKFFVFLKKKLVLVQIYSYDLGCSTGLKSVCNTNSFTRWACLDEMCSNCTSEGVEVPFVTCQNSGDYFASVSCKEGSGSRNLFPQFLVISLAFVTVFF